jgi:signal peptidase I
MWGSSKVTESQFYERGPEMGAAPKGRPQKLRPSRKGAGLLETLVVLLVSFALVFGVVRPFIVQSFWIPSESMTPTLEIGDRIFVNKFVYRFSEPERGDVVVFESKGIEDEDLIKRVIALPGDHVALYHGDLYVNFQRLDEPYVQTPYTQNVLADNSLGALTVPEGKILVLGDNRASSRDSRFFGPVSMDTIEGEAFAIFWPLSRIGLL